MLLQSLEDRERVADEVDARFESIQGDLSEFRARLSTRRLT